MLKNGKKSGDELIWQGPEVLNRRRKMDDVNYCVLMERIQAMFDEGRRKVEHFLCRLDKWEECNYEYTDSSVEIGISFFVDWDMENEAPMIECSVHTGISPLSVKKLVKQPYKVESSFAGTYAEELHYEMEEMKQVVNDRMIQWFQKYSIRGKGKCIDEK